MRTLFFILIFFLSASVFGQNGWNVQQPQFSTPQPMQSGKSYTQPTYQKQPTSTNKYGSTLQPKKANEMVNYGTTPQPKQEGAGYYTPNAENNFNQMSPVQREQYMLKTVLNEVAYTDFQMQSSGYYDSLRYKNDFPNYLKTKQHFKEMLSGKRKLSLKDAYYEMEAAYGSLHLTYKEYSDIIEKSAQFIKDWLLQNGYDLKNQEALHMGIQKFMGDKLSLKENTDNGGILNIPPSHQPFYYDFIDYRAIEDKRNYFLTKTLATGTGQCNTLPAVYLVLAEALGAEAYLCYAPQHSFIKFKNNKGVFQNYEPTIDWHMTDQDYAKELPIMATAIQKGLYLDPLNKKEIVASLLVDLALNFRREHWISDGEFIEDCVNTATQYFKDKDGGNAEVHYLRSIVLASKFNRVAMKNNIQDISKVNQNEEVAKAYAAYRNNERKITNLGLQGFPESKYIQMLQKHDKKGKLQAAKNIDTKSKKNLFVNY